MADEDPDGTGPEGVDPVEAASTGTDDHYGVAEWEPRGVLDELSVWLYGVLAGNRGSVLTVVAFLVFAAQLGGVLYIAGSNPWVAVVALLSAVPAFALAVLVWRQDVAEREPVDTLAITFLLAILFASFAAMFNSILGGLFRLIPVVGMAVFFFLVVGPIEEAVKLLAVRMHAYRTDTFDAVIDGAVYGAVAGLGFATIENVLYVVQAFARDQGTTTALALFPTGVSRALAGPGHVIYSAFAGYYLGLAKYNPDHRGPIVLKGLLVAAGIHALYNTIVTYAPIGGGLAFVGFVLVYDGLFLGLLYRKLSNYRETYEDVVDDEAEDGNGADSEDEDEEASEDEAGDGNQAEADSEAGSTA